MAEPKVILITGASSGMGLEASLQLAAQGHIVYASMRNLDKQTEIVNRASTSNISVTTLLLDVTQPDTIDAAVTKILEEQNKIDVLINNAGFGQLGALETLTIAQVKQELDTNFIGAIRCIQAVLPTMRSNKSGTIVNISSVAGIIGFPYGTVYGSTKFALEGLSEGLAQELLPWNINVRIVEPGPVATNFNKDMKFGERELADNPYTEKQKAFKEQMSSMQDMSISQTAEEAAKAIVDAATNENSALFRFPTSDWVGELVGKKLKDIYELSSMIS